MITGNIGEWSEIYVFLKLLGEGKLYAGNAKLEQLKNVYYPIISIIKYEKENSYTYERATTIRIIDNSTQEVLAHISIEKFLEKSTELLTDMKNAQGRAFSLPLIENFLKEIEIFTLKSPAANKEDITMIVHDFKTGLNPEISFSIKSHVGGAPTLLNASQATNFVYEIDITSNVINARQSLIEQTKNMGVKEIVKALNTSNYNLKYKRMNNSIFESNLQMIDSQLPEIVSELLNLYYKGVATTLKDLTALLEIEDPLNFGTVNKKFYAHKIKNLLLDIALGMKPATEWEGNYDATGGYITVRENGEIICYHIYNINEFKEYLFNNTKLETAARRNNFGRVYIEEGRLFLKLNLQIRFIK